MANPLQMLKLKAGGFQFIEEAVVSAPAKKVWKTILNPNGWFGFGERANWSKQTIEAWPGGRWHSEGKTGNTSLFGFVTLIEPGKLLRLSGPIGLSHLPVSNVLVLELTEQAGGKETLVKVCMRSAGFMDAGVKKRYIGAWKHLLPQLKTAAEGK